MHPDIEAWDAWPPQAAAVRLADVRFPWFVAAGWAIDLFLGRPTRNHGDLEIAVPHSLFETVPQRFADLDFYVPQGEGRLAPTVENLAGTWLDLALRTVHPGHKWLARL